MGYPGRNVAGKATSVAPLAAASATSATTLETPAARIGATSDWATARRDMRGRSLRQVGGDGRTEMGNDGKGGTTERRKNGTTETQTERETQMAAETARTDADTSETQTSLCGSKDIHSFEQPPGTLRDRKR